MSKQMPILVVNFQTARRVRVINLLRNQGFDCSPSDADTLLETIPDIEDLDDEDILDRLLPCVVVDWNKAEASIDETLRLLVEEEKAAAGNSFKLRRIHQRMCSFTGDLDEHPEWYESPCMCAECRSNA